MRVFQIKTLNFFFFLEGGSKYSAQVRHKCLIFQRSHQCVRYKSSGAHKVLEFLQTKILLVACVTTHTPLAVPLHRTGSLSSQGLFKSSKKVEIIWAQVWQVW